MKNSFLLFTSLFLLIFFCSYTHSQNVWTLTSTVSGVGDFPAITVPDSSTIWVAGNYSVMKSVNGGINFNNVSSNLPSGGPVLYSICAISASNCFVGDSGSTSSGANVYKTTNGGINWSTVFSTGGTNGCFKGIVFSKANPTVGVCLSDPAIGPGQAFWLQKTTNMGVTWIKQSPPGKPNSIAARNSLFVIDENFYGFGTENVLFNNECYIIYTSNGGSSWNSIQASVPGTAVQAIALSLNKANGIAITNQSLPVINITVNGFTSISQVNGYNVIGGVPSAKWVYGTDYVYVGATQNDPNGSIEESTDGGATWTQMNTDGLSSISQMDLVYTANRIYGYAVITYIGKIIKMTKQLTGVIKTSTIVPIKYNLYQNYPNPFNPSTKINFDVPADVKYQEENVKITVSDILGREIEVLVNENLKPGTYEISWNGSKYPSGVYVYSLTAGSFTVSKKMILVK